MNLPEPGDWRDWTQVPHGCTCHWSDLRGTGARNPLEARNPNILMPHGTWRYVAPGDACPFHRKE